MHMTRRMIDDETPTECPIEMNESSEWVCRWNLRICRWTAWTLCHAKSDQWSQSYLKPTSRTLRIWSAVFAHLGRWLRTCSNHPGEESRIRTAEIGPKVAVDRHWSALIRATADNFSGKIRKIGSDPVWSNHCHRWPREDERNVRSHWSCSADRLTCVVSVSTTSKVRGNSLNREHRRHDACNHAGTDRADAVLRWYVDRRVVQPNRDRSDIHKDEVERFHSDYSPKARSLDWPDGNILPIDTAGASPDRRFDWQFESVARESLWISTRGLVHRCRETDGEARWSGDVERHSWWSRNSLSSNNARVSRTPSNREVCRVETTTFVDRDPFEVMQRSWSWCVQSRDCWWNAREWYRADVRLPRYRSNELNRRDATKEHLDGLVRIPPMKKCSTVQSEYVRAERSARHFQPPRPTDPRIIEEDYFSASERRDSEWTSW